MTNEELAQRITAGDESYIAELWRQNEKFVRWRASRFFFSYEERCKSLVIDVDDLAQVGYFALLKSIKSYDPNRGTKFLTVFEYQLKRQFFTLAKMHYTGWQKNTTHQCAHLDEPITNADGLTLSDTIEDKSDEIGAVEERLYSETVRKSVHEALPVLTGRQFEVISAIYFDGLTFEMTAQRFGVSKGAINNIVRAGRNKLSENVNLRALCMS